MMWTTEKTLSLIEAFHNTPSLWDVHNTDYRDKVKKKMAFNKIADELNISSLDVEKKIHNLKTQFYREHKKATTKDTRGDSSGGTNWFAYKPLLFLHHRMDLLRNRENGLNGTLNGRGGDQKNSDIYDDLDYEPGTSAIPKNSYPPPSKKKKELDPVARQTELLTLACDLLSKNCREEETHECQGVAKVWGTKLMSLDPMQRKFAEKAINDILFEADMGTLHRNSVQINSIPSSDPLEIS